VKEEYSEKAVLATASQASKEEPAGRYRYPQIRLSAKRLAEPDVRQIGYSSSLWT